MFIIQLGVSNSNLINPSNEIPPSSPHENRNEYKHPSWNHHLLRPYQLHIKLPPFLQVGIGNLCPSKSFIFNQSIPHQLRWDNDQIHLSTFGWQQNMVWKLGFGLGVLPWWWFRLFTYMFGCNSLLLPPVWSVKHLQEGLTKQLVIKHFSCNICHPTSQKLKISKLIVFNFESKFCMNISSWWFQPIWKILVELHLHHFPKVRGENKTYLKPPPRYLCVN